MQVVLRQTSAAASHGPAGLLGLVDTPRRTIFGVKFSNNGTDHPPGRDPTLAASETSREDIDGRRDPPRSIDRGRDRA